MSLAPFIGRAADSAATLLPSTDRAEFLDELAEVAVKVSIDNATAQSEAMREGFLLAVNLLARLYPQIAISAPDGLDTEARSLARSINPSVQLDAVEADIGLSFCGEPDNATTTVLIDGWNVLIDEPSQSGQPAVMEAALIGACFGVANVFRTAFRGRLPHGRHGVESGIFNPVTGLCEAAEIPKPAGGLDLTGLTIVGAGAIGQAAVKTLGFHELFGQASVVDPEEVDLGNLQRYVLTRMGDVGRRKARMSASHLRHSGASVEEYPVPWAQSGLAERGVDTALLGLDSAEDRIAVQAGLPRVVMNAWTQPIDLGWSRHENFANEPCVACLYWATERRPSLDQLIADSVSQPVHRVRLYLVSRTRVDHPLPNQVIQANSVGASEDERRRWASVPILSDILAAEADPTHQADRWVGAQLDQLYREGVCGGALILDRFGASQGLIVPAAFQSAFAGVMLATQYIVASNEQLVSARGGALEYRVDLLRRLPQQVGRPRAREERCFCSDSDFADEYLERWRDRSVPGDLSRADAIIGPDA